MRYCCCCGTFGRGYYDCWCRLSGTTCTGNGTVASRQAIGAPQCLRRFTPKQAVDCNRECSSSGAGLCHPRWSRAQLSMRVGGQPKGPQG